MATNEIEFIDFDLYQLEELKDFEVPAEGTYEWEGVSIKTVQDDELKEGATEKNIYTVVTFKLLNTIELKNPEKNKPLTEPQVLSVRVQLNNRTDKMKFAEGAVRAITVPVAEAYGLTMIDPITGTKKANSKAVAEKFPGTKGTMVITNRHYISKTKLDDQGKGMPQVSWDIKLVTVA